MGQVTVTLNGRAYRLRCDDGDEQRLFALADHVRGKIDALVREFGQVGDDRLLLMAALLVADEYFDARTKVAPADGPPAEPVPQRPQRAGRKPESSVHGPHEERPSPIERKLGAA